MFAPKVDYFCRWATSLACYEHAWCSQAHPPSLTSFGWGYRPMNLPCRHIALLYMFFACYLSLTLSTTFEKGAIHPPLFEWQVHEAKNKSYFWCQMGSWLPLPFCTRFCIVIMLKFKAPTWLGWKPTCLKSTFKIRWN